MEPDGTQRNMKILLKTSAAVSLSRKHDPLTRDNTHTCRDYFVYVSLRRVKHKQQTSITSELRMMPSMFRLCHIIIVIRFTIDSAEGYIEKVVLPARCVCDESEWVMIFGDIAVEFFECLFMSL